MAPSRRAVCVCLGVEAALVLAALAGALSGCQSCFRFLDTGAAGALAVLAPVYAPWFFLPCAFHRLFRFASMAFIYPGTTNPPSLTAPKSRILAVPLTLDYGRP